MGSSSGALPSRDIIIRELSSQVLVFQAPHSYAPTHRALTGRDGVPRESIVKSSGCVPATPTTPTSKNVVGKVPAKEAPCDKETMPIRPPGTLKCPQLPLQASQSISVSFVATTCQQRQGNHHQQSSDDRTVGVPIRPKHKLLKSHPYQERIRSKKGRL
uniref:Uncharacterized protein n=1 Tax=Populus trichocarpa TaxID=3694 RepID=A0A2K1WTK1_POPTR